ncbi:thermonuclease family protein [Patescibacteria group bacterium]|nr:thermonuclease family protein [Patescibacteria group bacterium]
MLNFGKKITIGALLAILTAVGYGGYTVIKKTDLEGLKEGRDVLYKVERVIDGDTIELEDGDVVRLVGIDAPEKGECFHKESTKALVDLIEGKKVELREDVTGQDEFGRLLRYVFLPNAGPLEDKFFVGGFMVQEGFAKHRSNPLDRLYFDSLLEKEEQAMMAGRGLWGECDYEVSARSQEHVEPLDEECVIKGNISTEAFGRTYFLPECANYGQVKVDLSRGEQYFCSEAEAIEAGFKKATMCP